MACMVSTVSADFEPVVHDVYAPLSQTWQYVVVDPGTKHCVLIDPVMDPGDSQLSGKPADEVLAVVRRNRYKVDMIVETHASPHEGRSGAWYLRMQLRESQGYAPRVTSGQTVLGVEKLFARKYGTALQTTLDGDFKDGEQVDVGHMSMKVLHMPGICTPDGRGYQIGMNLFGGHGIANLKNRMRQDSFSREIERMNEDDCHSLWESFQKILGLPPDYRVFFDRGRPDLSKVPRVRFDEAASRPGTARTDEGLHDTSFVTVAHCRNLSSPIDVTASEFMTAWEQCRGRIAGPSVEYMQQVTPRSKGKMPVKEDAVLVKKASRTGNFFGWGSKK